MAVVVGGDIAVALLEELIPAQFTDVAARSSARPDPSLGEIVKSDGVRTYFHSEAEMPTPSISLLSLTPAGAEPDAGAHRLNHLPRQIALAMLHRRFSKLAKKENAPFLGAGAYAAESFKFMREATVSITCKPGQGSAALAVGKPELRRALAPGFRAPELKAVLASFTNSLDHAVKTAPTRRSHGLAGMISQHLPDRPVTTHPAAERAPSTCPPSPKSPSPTASRPCAPRSPRRAAL